jgi:hypothetical protein
MTHDQAIARALLAITRAGGRGFRHEVGAFRDARGSWHRIGTAGEPDVMGCAPGGRALAVEVKVNRDRLRPEQAAFAKAWTALGGLHVVARYSDDEDGDATIREALAEKNPSAT